MGSAQAKRVNSTDGPAKFRGRRAEEVALEATTLSTVPVGTEGVPQFDEETLLNARKTVIRLAKGQDLFEKNEDAKQLMDMLGLRIYQQEENNRFNRGKVNVTENSFYRITTKRTNDS